MKNVLIRYSKEIQTNEYPKDEIINALKGLKNILESTHTLNDHKSFFYKSAKDLILAQLQLLELGFHCVQVADFADYQLRSYYYNILTALFLRGEFNLENVRFKKNVEGSLIKPKQNIGLKFQSLLYKTLHIALSKLTIKGLTSDQSEFVNYFLAIAFVKIPEFHKQILESLHRDSDTHYEDAIQISKGKEEKKCDSIYNLYNWVNEFYD